MGEEPLQTKGTCSPGKRKEKEGAKGDKEVNDGGKEGEASSLAQRDTPPPHGSRPARTAAARRATDARKV